MEAKKNIVILVADYPYSSGEPFLEDELKILEPDFNTIYLLQVSKSHVKKREFELYVPNNSIVTELYTGNFKLSPLQKIIEFLSLRFIYEFFIAVFKHKVPFTLALLKLNYYYWSNSFLGMKAIETFIKKENIDINTTVFYSYWCDFHAISLARLKKKTPQLNFVTRLHGWDLYFERHHESFLPFREFIFKKANKIIPISNDGRKYILEKKLSIQPEKIITSRLGVKNLETNVRYKVSKEELEHIFGSQSIQADTDSNNIKTNVTNSETLIVLTLSSINPVKRLDKLIDAIKEINSFNIEWHHIGNGIDPYETTLKQIAQTKLKNLKNISYTFHGKFPKKEVDLFLQNTPVDVIINCSDNEGIPVAIMEAMSAGIPAIAFNVGGIPGIVTDGKTGILLDCTTKDEVGELRNAMEEFYRLEKGIRIILSQNAKRMWKENYNNTINFGFISKLISSQITEAPVIYCQQCLVGSDIYPEIIIDKYGICNVCKIVERKINDINIQRDKNFLPTLLHQIKKQKETKKYDCILGISGGIDSAYLALKAKEWGLNPLLVHVDNGWNSETAVYNIQILIKNLGFELYTVVIDWNEIKDLVRAFLKASVIDIDWANEMCFQAALYEVASKFGIKNILTGHQVATEGWMPDNVVHYKLDLINFKYIHKKFGEHPLKTYPTIGFLKWYYLENIRGIKYYYPLDYIEYNKEKAKNDLVEKYGWRDYGQKHFESIFTRFYQGYILPKKFKIDKRRFHFSALILSKQLTKMEASNLLLSDEYIASGQMQQDKEYVIKKLDFTNEEFEAILKATPKQHSDYPSIINIIRKLRFFKRIIQNN